MMQAGLKRLLRLGRSLFRGEAHAPYAVNAMNTDSDARQRPHHIDEAEDASRAYVIQQEQSNDLLVRTGRQLIEACRLGISVEVWMDEFRDMVEAVRAWIADRTDRITACYATPRGGSIGLFFVPAKDAFDFDLADELATLNRELLKQFNVGIVEIQQIPADETPRFIPPDAAVSVYPHERSEQSTHRPMEA